MKLFNSKYILSDKRHGWIDYDRGISIILVTYRHCYETMEKAGLNMHEHPWLEYINVFFFGFRMPLFFIASGMFISGSMKKRGLNPYIDNRIKTILYPLLVWGIIQISLQLVFADYTNSKGEVDFKSYLYLITFPRATGQFWYLNALFFVGIIYAVLKSVFKVAIKYQLILGLLLYFTCSYFSTHNIQVGALNDIFKYYLFFAIGDAISGFMLSEKTATLFTSRKVIIPLLISFIIIQLIFTNLNLKSGKLTVTPNFGRAPYSFSLDNQSFGSTKPSKSFTFNDLSQGYHTVNIKDAYGCIETFTKKINDDSKGFDSTVLNATNCSNLVKNSILVTATKCSNYHVENDIPLFFLLVALVGCAMSIAFSFTLKKYNKLKFIRIVGYNSVHIYCLQIIVMSVSRMIFIKFLGINNVPLLALLILSMGVLVPMVIYNVSLRFNLWWMFTLKKPTEEIAQINLN
jgi:fucose 4-O-acetylase-like acetyltransferase